MEKRYIRECATFDEITEECYIKDKRCPQLDADRICCKYFRDWVAPGIKIERRTELKTKSCADCGKLFRQEKPRQRFCPDCQKRHYLEKHRKYNKTRE